MVEKDPSRNQPLRLLFGSLTEEDSILTLNIPMPNSLLPMPKPPSQTPGHFMAAVKGKPIPPNKTKSKKGQKDLCETGSPCLVSQEEKLENSSTKETEMPEATAASMKRKGSPLENAKNEKKRKDLMMMTDVICTAENEKTENLHGETKSGCSEPGTDAFPPKAVALHRVRWNMNKGSERWLAYGGAAGIVRCQEITTLPTKIK